MLKHYENRACPDLIDLMGNEAITYSVLIKILQGECAHVFTDGERAIVCHSASPWPAWVWCRDVSDDRTVAEIGQCLKTHFPVERGYDIILSRELLVSLRDMDSYFQSVKDGMGLLSYRLDLIEALGSGCRGSMGLVREDEVMGLIEIWQAMHMEMEGRSFTPERCEQSLRRMVGEKSLFAWRSEEGRILALTGRADQPPYSKITSVYTLPEYRRKGYALHLVHGVTEIILADGLIPILYTNAGYVASNACYKKIGYRQVGCLCSVCK